MQTEKEIKKVVENEIIEKHFYRGEYIVKERSKSLDIAKGFAVFLMVWGHCIQYGNGSMFLQQRSFFDNIVFRAIYSFHMPLFAVIAGYLQALSLNKRDSFEMIHSRVKSLGIPILAWSIVNFVIVVHTKGLAKGFIGILKQHFWILMGTHWFLWALLMCAILVIILHSFCKDAIWVFGILLILNFIIPDRFNLNYFKYLYPFFSAGYLWFVKDIGKRLSIYMTKNNFCSGTDCPKTQNRILKVGTKCQSLNVLTVGGGIHWVMVGIDAFV